MDSASASAEYSENPKDKPSELKETVSAVADQVRQARESAQRSFETYVREQPIRSILVAFGAGVIFALLIHK
ncbi:MAG: hypothetical protein JOZ31_22280 [Verrucomicrobia bacterium]|nr:hypothetical protein [Verrucomicrobiota bacterium]